MIGRELRIERALRASLPGAKLIRVWPLEGGISAQMTAFEIDIPGEGRKRMIARQPSNYKFRNDARVAQSEFRLLQILRQAGLPVPFPRFVEEVSSDVQEPFFVVDFIDGSPDVSPRNPAEFLRRYANQFVQIHRVDWRALDCTFLDQQPESLGPRPQVLNDSLREGEIRDALKSIPVRPQSTGLVLRHGDFWPGNILWREGEIAGVIDWEEALIDEPLADLAISRLDLLWILGMDAMNDFTNLYQSQMTLDLSDLAYWDLWASLRPIANIHEWAPSYPQLGRPDITEQTMCGDHQAFVHQALQNIRR